MKTLNIELPNKVSETLTLLVNSGWFKDEKEIIKLALWEFIQHHNFELMEQFQLEDIQWAIKQKEQEK